MAVKKGVWADTPKAGKVIIIGLGAAGVIWGINAIAKNAEARRQKERLDNREQTECGGVNLSAVAYGIWDACWNYAGGMAEDEETMIQYLLQVPKECIQSLAVVYYHDFEKNLFDDFRTYLEGEDYKRVQHLLE